MQWDQTHLLGHAFRVDEDCAVGLATAAAPLLLALPRQAEVGLLHAALAAHVGADQHRAARLAALAAPLALALARHAVVRLRLVAVLARLLRLQRDGTVRLAAHAAPALDALVRQPEGSELRARVRARALALALLRHRRAGASG